MTGPLFNFCSINNQLHSTVSPECNDVPLQNTCQGFALVYQVNNDYIDKVEEVLQKLSWTFHPFSPSRSVHYNPLPVLYNRKVSWTVVLSFAAQEDKRTVLTIEPCCPWGIFCFSSGLQGATNNSFNIIFLCPSVRVSLKFPSDSQVFKSSPSSLH